MLITRKTEKRRTARQSFTVTEAFYMENGVFIVMFLLDHPSNGMVHLGATLAPGIVPQREGERIMRLCARNGDLECSIVPIPTTSVFNVRVVKGFYSNQYGSVRKTVVVQYSWASYAPYYGLVIFVGHNARKGVTLQMLEEQLYKKLAYWRVTRRSDRQAFLPVDLDQNEDGDVTKRRNHG